MQVYPPPSFLWFRLTHTPPCYLRISYGRLAAALLHLLMLLRRGGGSRCAVPGECVSKHLRMDSVCDSAAACPCLANAAYSLLRLKFIIVM
jgi:hypothetical protein